jgi:hypothetical protein
MCLCLDWMRSACLGVLCFVFCVLCFMFYEHNNNMFVAAS